MDDYEIKEREAILATDNDVKYHPTHLKNKAAKEIRQRIPWTEWIRAVEEAAHKTERAMDDR